MPSRSSRPAVGPSVWERPEPPDRPAPVKLSRDAIVTAAVALADREGLTAVSIRNVAAALNAGPMRLYGYVATKDELLDLMVDAVYGDMSPQKLTGDWRADVRARVLRGREVISRHPWVLDLLGGRAQLGPNALAHMEASFAATRQAPQLNNIDVALQAVRTVNAYVIGALQNERREHQAELASGMKESPWRELQAPYISELLATGHFPNLSDVMHQARHPSTDATFIAGLESVLDGLDARSPRQTRRASSEDRAAQ